VHPVTPLATGAQRRTILHVALYAPRGCHVKRMTLIREASQPPSTCLTVLTRS